MLKTWSEFSVLVLTAGLLVSGCGRNATAKQAAKADAQKSPYWSEAATKTYEGAAKALREQQLDRLKEFSEQKEKQSRELAAMGGEEITPEIQAYFDAAKAGDWKTVLETFAGFSRRHPQYRNKSNDTSLVTSYWSPVLEICLAYQCVLNTDPSSTQIFADEIIHSIPPGAIYFGGTDPGRGLITAFCKSQADGDPFFTLTQNALADGGYVDYLRRMYGNKIAIPSAAETPRAFEDFKTDARQRLQHDRDHPEEQRQIKPGEDLRLKPDGDVGISGQVAVMEVNGLLAKMIVDANSDRDFYIEVSFPLDWMYPYLEPHGPILKLNHVQVDELPGAVIEQDHEYWRKCLAPLIGDWVTEKTTVNKVAEFGEKVFVKKSLWGFKGDRNYLENQRSQFTFAKLRCSIAEVYAWRMQHAVAEPERDAMRRAADFAFRQAFALCPASPETVFKYLDFLLAENRIDDALLVASTASKADPRNGGITGLVRQLKAKKNKA